MRRWSSGLVAGLILLAPLLSATPAHAAVKGRIVSLEARGGELHIVFSAAGLGDGQGVDPSTVKVTLGDVQLAPKVELASAAQTAGVLRRVVLTIDTSGSMTTNNRIGAAKAAATAYLARVPSDVEVGLVTFSSTAVARVQPTKDRARVRTAVLGLVATGNTALYDAVRLGITMLGSKGDRSLLILSDGKDEGSRTTLAANVLALKKAKVPVNAVLLGDTSAQPAVLALSNAAGGRVVSARAAADLTRTFEQAARETDRDVAITAAIPEGYTGGEAPLTVTAVAGGQQISDTALAVNLISKTTKVDPAAFGPRAVQPITGLFSHAWLLWLALLALFAGVGGLFAFALNAFSGRDANMRGRLKPFVDTANSPRRADPETSRNFRETAVGFADDLVKTRGLEESLSKKLEAGGVPLRAAEWLIIHIGFALVLPLMVILLTSLNIALTIVSVIVGILGPLMYLTVKAALRTRKFLAQLPDTLQLLSGSLSAGYSLPQALDAVVRQGLPPMAEELRKALVEARLGAPVEDALDDVADRMESKDFSWVVMAIRIQRQVGGNLAEVLATTAATLRERERLRRQVQVLSAEGRLSAYILFGLPVLFALYLLATRPVYLKPLIDDPLGWVMLGGMGLFLTVGALWLRKVVQVEV